MSTKINAEQTRKEALADLFLLYRKANDDYYDSVDNLLGDLNAGLLETYGDTDKISRSTVFLEKLSKDIMDMAKDFYPKK